MAGQNFRRFERTTSYSANGPLTLNAIYDTHHPNADEMEVYDTHYPNRIYREVYNILPNGDIYNRNLPNRGYGYYLHTTKPHHNHPRSLWIGPHLVPHSNQNHNIQLGLRYTQQA
jgi:hypothetical protein